MRRVTGEPRGLRDVPGILIAGRARVVVTGIGLCCGLGAGRESVWPALRSGRSGARFLEPGRFGMRAPDVGCPVDGGEHDAGQGERVLAIVERTVDEALADARLLRTGTAGPDRLSAEISQIATLIGLSKGCVRNLGRLADAA